MKEFLLIMWKMREIDEAYLLTKVPSRITRVEYSTIISIPQIREVKK